MVSVNTLNNINFKIVPSIDGSQIGNDPFGRVLTEDGDCVMTLKTEVDETSGHELNLRVIFFVSPSLQHPVLLHSKSNDLQKVG